MKPRISVIMAIYNGRKYLTEQLESIFLQTVGIDEIIMIDDHSPETSVDIVEEYKKKTNCEIAYIEHEKNEGYAQTFFDALRLATGDYILFSDQDDIWMKTKVECCLETMKNHPDISCLSSCNIYIDSIGNEFGKESIPHRRLIRIKAKDLLKQSGLRPGMTLIIRKELMEKVNQMDTTSYKMHDRLIEYLSATEDGFFLLGEYLNKYRIHDNNTSGMNRSFFKLRSGKEGRIQQIDKEINYLNQIRSIDIKNEYTIGRLISYYSVRKELLKKGNIFKYVVGSGKIFYGYSSYKIWFGDILSIIRG